MKKIRSNEMSKNRDLQINAYFQPEYFGKKLSKNIF